MRSLSAFLMQNIFTMMLEERERERERIVPPSRKAIIYLKKRKSDRILSKEKKKWIVLPSKNKAMIDRI